MSKRKKISRVPAYRQDRTDPKKAIAVWKDAEGKPRRRSLPGEFNSPESRIALEALKAEVKVSEGGVVSKKRSVSIPELLEAYLKYARGYYQQSSGTTTSMVGICESVAKVLCAQFADKPASGFGPLLLKSVIEKWVKEGRSRDGINRWLGIIKRVFKWAASEELVPVDVYLALTTVSGLRRGRTEARETDPIEPVTAFVVNATLRHVNRFVHAMILVQWFTGMRPGEACRMRRCEIDMSGDVWLYKPAHHKTAHKGKSRIIPIGPKTQEVLKKFFTDDPEDYLFRASEAVKEAHARRSAMRRIPRWPSHMARNRRKRKRSPVRTAGEHYLPHSYACAIKDACDKAFPLPAEIAQDEGESWRQWQERLTEEQKDAVKKWRKEHRWHPNQIRHAFATHVRRDHGLEAAQVLLGHSRADTTQIYAERNVSLASEVAAKIG
jgi:integrase